MTETFCATKLTTREHSLSFHDRARSTCNIHVQDDTLSSTFNKSQASDISIMDKTCLGVPRCLIEVSLYTVRLVLYVTLKVCVAIANLRAVCDFNSCDRGTLQKPEVNHRISGYGSKYVPV